MNQKSASKALESLTSGNFWLLSSLSNLPRSWIFHRASMQEPRARKSDIMTFHSLGCCAPCGSCLLRKLHVFMYRCHFHEDSPPERSARFFGIVGISGFLRKIRKTHWHGQPSHVCGSTASYTACTSSVDPEVISSRMSPPQRRRTWTAAMTRCDKSWSRWGVNCTFGRVLQVPAGPLTKEACHKMRQHTCSFASCQYVKNWRYGNPWKRLFQNRCLS